MPDLPATLLEAEALAFAREWIAWQHEPGRVFHPDAERQYGRVLMKQFALEHPFGCDEIVYFAENGSREADYALRELIAERTDRGEPLGAVLGAYNIRLLNPLRPARSGPGKADNFVRDCAISLLVEMLMDRFGPALRPMRNTVSKKASACSIAAQALAEGHTGILLTPKGVERVWQQYLPSLIGTEFAARFFPAGIRSRPLFDRPRSSAAN